MSPSRPMIAGWLVVPAVLLVHAPHWLASLTDSREPLVGFAAVPPAAYYLFWLALSATTAVEFGLLGVVLLTLLLPITALSYLCVSIGWELVEQWRSPVGPWLGLAVISVINAGIVTAPLMLIEACLITPQPSRFRPVRHLLGGVAVAPLLILAMLLHTGVRARGDLNWLLAFPTLVLISAHFLLEAGATVPHALATLPGGRAKRAWALLPAALIAGWLAQVALAGAGLASRPGEPRLSQPFARLGEFARRINDLRAMVWPSPDG